MREVGNFSFTNWRSLAGMVFLLVAVAMLAQIGLTWSFGGHVQL